MIIGIGAQFSPDNGPCKGGTLVTIDGLNLGKTFADIRDGVTVGGVKCEPVEEQYVPSIRCWRTSLVVRLRVRVRVRLRFRLIILFYRSANL